MIYRALFRVRLVRGLLVSSLDLGRLWFMKAMVEQTDMDADHKTGEAYWWKDRIR